jgi:hydrogenase expression/formation protein HypE
VSIWTEYLRRRHNFQGSGARHPIHGLCRRRSGGSADKLFITTAGVGLVPDGISISASNAKPGDVIIVSGNIGDRGMAVWSTREGLEFESAIMTDTAPLNHLVDRMTQAGEVHVLRDPTHGELAMSLCEIAVSSEVGIEIDANSVPVQEDVKAACETLGMDPLFVANEGKLVAMVAPSSARAVLEAVPYGRDACVIGNVVEAHPKMAILKTEIGGSRVLDLPFVEQLPRIC